MDAERDAVKADYLNELKIKVKKAIEALNFCCNCETWFHYIKL